MLSPLKGHNDVVYCVAFSPDGSKIISGSWDKTIQVWDARTGVKMLSPLKVHDDVVYSIAFSLDGSNIMGFWDKTIQVWDASTGHNDAIYSIAFSPDGSKIISGSWDKTIQVWDMSTIVEYLSSQQNADVNIPMSALDSSPTVSL
jgi:WD40 repeat protein